MFRPIEYPERIYPEGFILKEMEGMKVLLVAGMLIMLLLFLSFSRAAAEKMKFGSCVKMSPVYYLPILGAEERGIWKQNGLEVEWVPFSGASPMHQAMLTGAIPLGLCATAGPIMAIAAGVPAVIVAGVQKGDLFVLFVRAGSPIRELKDLKGAKLGIPRFGGPAEAYSKLVAKSVGLEKDIKLVGLGDIPQILAGLRTGIVDGAVEPTHLMIKLKFEGLIRELARVDRYLPKEWVGQVLVGQKAFVQKERDATRRLVKALLSTIVFLEKEPGWAIQKMVSFHGLTLEMAREVYSEYEWASDGRISRKGLQDAINFLVEFGVLAKERAPWAEDILTTEFVR